MSDYYDRELEDTIERNRVSRRQCFHPDCTTRAVWKRADGRWLCRTHYPLWKTHRRILRKILAIPPRD